jgi:hypothetical protein
MSWFEPMRVAVIFGLMGAHKGHPYGFIPALAGVLLN